MPKNNLETLTSMTTSANCQALIRQDGDQLGIAIIDAGTIDAGIIDAELLMSIF